MESLCFLNDHISSKAQLHPYFGVGVFVCVFFLGGGVIHRLNSHYINFILMQCFFGFIATACYFQGALGVTLFSSNSIQQPTFSRHTGLPLLLSNA